MAKSDRTREEHLTSEQTDFPERFDRFVKDAVLAEKLREKEQRDLLEDLKRGAADLENILSASHDATDRIEPSDSGLPNQLPTQAVMSKEQLVEKRKGCLHAYTSQFPPDTKVVKLDICWAAGRTHYSHFKSFMRGKIGENSEVAKRIYSVLKSDKHPKKLVRTPRPKGWR